MKLTQSQLNSRRAAKWGFFVVFAAFALVSAIIYGSSGKPKYRVIEAVWEYPAWDLPEGYNHKEEVQKRIGAAAYEIYNLDLYASENIKIFAQKIHDQYYKELGETQPKPILVEPERKELISAGKKHFSYRITAAIAAVALFFFVLNWYSSSDLYIRKLEKIELKNELARGASKHYKEYLNQLARISDEHGI